MAEIVADRTFKVWKRALSSVLDNGTKYEDQENRTCIESMNLSLKIRKPEEDIKEPIKRLNKFERWIYPSLEEIKDFILSKGSSMGYEYSYGERIFSYHVGEQKKDQINDFIVPLLKNSEKSRRAVITLWNPLKDANIFKKEIPGTILIDFKVRNNMLHTTEMIRSNDLFYGWPANIFQCFKLQELVADKLNVSIGSLSSFSTSAHIFSEQKKYIDRVLSD